MPNIIDTAINEGKLSEFLNAVDDAGLTDFLSGPGQFTVFAPTDDAFTQLPVGTLSTLLDNVDQLRQVLTYHIISGRITSDDIKLQDIHTASTLEGENLNIDTPLNARVQVNNATVISGDIMCDNGVIHIIDEVLLPPSIHLAKAA
ncbi:MAG: fasciclin domain-containing protein [Armatimonadota bacterium]